MKRVPCVATTSSLWLFCFSMTQDSRHMVNPRGRPLCVRTKNHCYLPHVLSKKYSMPTKFSEKGMSTSHCPPERLVYLLSHTWHFRCSMHTQLRLYNNVLLLAVISENNWCICIQASFPFHSPYPLHAVSAVFSQH